MNGKQYSFLSPIVNDKEVVLLGESIHLTREFPLVRIGMIKYLNQNHDFNVIAMEGGAADYWAAQDILFSSEKNESDFTEALSAFPFIWNTPEVQELIAYQASTLQSENSLYKIWTFRLSKGCICNRFIWRMGEYYSAGGEEAVSKYSPWYNIKNNAKKF